MKNILIGILCLCLLLSMAGCANIHNSTQGTDVTTDHTNSTGDVHVAQKPMVAVSVPVITESETATDGTVIFNHTYQNISLVVPDPNVADKVILDFLNRTDINEYAESIRFNAEQAYNEGIITFSPYLAQITYDPVRIDHGVLSMYGCYATYSGAAHAEYIYRSVNYDLVTGSVLLLENIFSNLANPDLICQLVLDDLTAQKESSEESLFAGFETTVNDLFDSNFLQNTNWFFSNTGLCFFFSPYEIGPFSSGDIVAEIPYSKLTGILNDAYFPAERETVFGVIKAETFDETALDGFSQLAEVIINKDSEKVLLYTDTSVYDIRIEAGAWSADGTVFTPNQTVFAAYRLTPGDAIMIDSSLSNTLPTLRLSCTAKDKTVSYMIGFNVTENKVTLTQR